MVLRFASLFLLLIFLSAQSMQATAGELRNLNGLDELKAEFNRGAGVPRLVLLLSPT